jgi:hypothetical protein
MRSSTVFRLMASEAAHKAREASSADGAIVLLQAATLWITVADNEDWLLAHSMENLRLKESKPS